MLSDRIQEHIDLISGLKNQQTKIMEMAMYMASIIAEEGTIAICGNGGSHSQAQHVECELVGRFYEDRPGFRAVCLGGSPATMTAVANDYSYGQIFARHLAALHRNAPRSTVLWCLSTSGTSRNVITAASLAQQSNISVMSLTGVPGSFLENQSHVNINVDSRDPARIQEIHLIALHLVCEIIEENLSGNTD